MTALPQHNANAHQTMPINVAASPPSVGEFFQLMKPRVMSLVIFTGMAGIYLAPGDIHPLLAAISLLAIAAGAGASGAINQWYDRDIDAIMTRTKNRPIPAGRVAPAEAIGFGVVISVLSVLLLSLSSNLLAGGLLAFTIFFYAVIYTIWLKRATPQNIVIGGAAGALPPMVGWASVTGNISAESIALFVLIFVWTPPHFWALALVKNEDYTKAGIPMLPVVAGPDETRKQIVIYAVLLVIAGFVPVMLGMAGAGYAILAGIMGGLFFIFSLQLYLQKTNIQAWRLFKFSIIYLFVMFAGLIVNRFIDDVFIQTGRLF